MDDQRLQAARREFDAWSTLDPAQRLQRIESCSDPDLRALMLEWLAPDARTEPGRPHSGGAARPAWAGQALGSYRLDGVLGEGGMGLVFAATDLRDGREVAIKRVRPGLATPTLMRRLEREFALMQRVDHPGIVRPLALETDAEGAPFLVLERVRGVSFAEAELDRPLRERVQLIARAAELAGVAHAQGIVHRDIKPSNLMIGADDSVYLLDFGITKSVADEAMTALTQTGERMLTPRYAAPEQFRGETVGASADVFALGTMLLDSVFGADATVPAGSGLLPREAEWLRAIISHSRDPLAPRRYADATALAIDLRLWQQGRRPRAASWLRHLQGRRSALVAVVVLLLLAASFGAWQWQVQRRLQPIDRGLALLEADLDGLSSASAETVRLALAADADGDRARAQTLMRAAAEDDSSHPLPALYLAMWERGTGGVEQLQRLGRLVRQRRDIYWSLLSDWLSADEGSPARTEQVLRAALDLRPAAWRLRLALAHQGLLRGDDAAARRELAAIDATQLDAKRATIVLGDRAMLGDTAEVRAQLPALAQRDALAAQLVETVLALAESRCGDAIAGMDALIAKAKAAHRPDLAQRAALIDLLCRGQLARWNELLDRGRLLLRGDGSERDPGPPTAAAILAAIAAARLGDDGEALRLLAQVDGEAVSGGLRLDIALTRRMLGLPDPVLADLQQSAMVAADPALSSLVRAYLALGEGDRSGAKQALADARRDGIRDSLFKLQSEWLGRQLGEARSAEPARLPMLWYPPTSRWAARW